MKKLFVLLAACAQLVSLSPAAVGDKADFSSLRNTTFYQGKVSPDDLRGKVVFIEYWGLACGPCREYMPQLQALYAKHKDQGFVVIATHCQIPNPQMNKDFFAEKKLTFSSCEQFHLPQGQPDRSLPFSVLVGANGKVVAMGYPTKVEPLVEAEMKKIAGGAPILADLELKKYAKLQTTIVEGAPNIEAKVEALRSKTDDEAQQICSAYDSWLEMRKGIIAGQKNSDALKFISQANTLKKSVPSLTDFDEDLATLTSDPAYTQLSEASKKMKSMRKKVEDGKKVSPKAIGAMIDNLKGLKPRNEAFNGSIDNMTSSLEELKNMATAAAGSKKKR